MREVFAEKNLNYVSKYYQLTDTEKIKIKYGLEVLYTIITKTLGILFISLFLKTFKETIILMIFYLLLRLFSHGIHAKKSSHCWFASILTYGAFPLLIKYYVINKFYILIMSIIALVCFIIWAPADTPKKPLINKKKRVLDKLLTVAISTVLMFIPLLSNNSLINNCIFFSYIMSIISINPLTYKLFGIPFNNYKNYKKGLN